MFAYILTSFGASGVWSASQKCFMCSQAWNDIQQIWYQKNQKELVYNMLSLISIFRAYILNKRWFSKCKVFLYSHGITLLNIVYLTCTASYITCIHVLCDRARARTQLPIQQIQYRMIITATWKELVQSLFKNHTENWQLSPKAIILYFSWKIRLSRTLLYRNELQRTATHCHVPPRVPWMTQSHQKSFKYRWFQAPSLHAPSSYSESSSGRSRPSHSPSLASETLFSAPSVAIGGLSEEPSASSGPSSSVYLPLPTSLSGSCRPVA